MVLGAPGRISNHTNDRSRWLFFAVERSYCPFGESKLGLKDAEDEEKHRRSVLQKGNEDFSIVLHWLWISSTRTGTLYVIFSDVKEFTAVWLAQFVLQDTGRFVPVSVITCRVPTLFRT